MAVAPIAAGTPVGAASALTIHVGQAKDFSRVDFKWTTRARMTVSRSGQVLTIRFDRDARPNVATLQTFPLKWIKSVDVRHDGGAIEFVFTLADGADAVTGEADGANFVNVFAKPAPPAAPPASASAGQTPSPSRLDPVPRGGVVPVRVSQTGQQLRLDFQWANPCGAAVFRRGDAIWVVFDAAARLDISRAPKNAAQFVSMQTSTGPDYTVLRIITRDPIAFGAISDGVDWGVVLQPQSQLASTPVKLTRDDSNGPAELTAAMAGPTGVYWVDDPSVGDKVGVVTALGPVKGVSAQRDFMQFTVLQSAQGMAVENHIDDLDLAFSGDIISLSTPKGLDISTATNRIAQASSVDTPRPASLPGLFGAGWADTGGAGYLARYDALVTPVANEEEAGAEGPTAGHMALARFLLGEGLSFEAIGVLNDAFRTHPTLGGDAEFRALRGMARAMAHRYKEAETDLAAPVLADDPAAGLWRGYALAETGQWADAKKAFIAGGPALARFPPLWQQRFAREAAVTALALGDVGGARSWINYALANPANPDDDARSKLVDAEVDQAEGDTAVALGEFQALAQLPQDYVAGPALLRATQIQLAQNTMTPTQAINVFEGLRYRWRGGTFELDTIRALGRLYLSQGRYREALETLRSAGKDLPDLPEAAQLQADMDAAFRTLFLGGMADGLQPVEALGLFYDFKELTPVGVDGDEMVRRLVRRLVDVDLLPQAEQLLKYQVDNRLDGAPKAEVATDLAVIYLMDRKPEDALDAINASRTTVLPQQLNLERRIITARALAELGRYGLALEMLGSDSSPDATNVRAEIFWDEKDWPQAGAIFEKLLGDRYKSPGPLSSIEEGQLLRAAAAFSLAGDDASLTRLRQRWTPFVAGARDPNALRVAMAGLNSGEVSPADFSRIATDDQLFVGWVAQMKARFDQSPPPAARPPLTQRQASADAPPPAPRRG